MNVAFDPWIPVVGPGGKRKLVSLCSVFTEGEKFLDLAVRPHERVSLMRLFICVAHAALDGPKNYPEWLKTPRLLPDAAENYLHQWNVRKSFDLFHKEWPWLQVRDLKATDDSTKTSPVALLDPELATGNTTTLFDHRGLLSSRAIYPAKLALNLLTFQNFAPGGGVPIAQWTGRVTKQVGNPDAPCLSQSMNHCLLRGRNLFETLHLNLPSYDNVRSAYGVISIEKETKRSYFTPATIGRPVWEHFPSSPDDLPGVLNATKTYLGRLVPLSRWIRLIENTDEMYCCNGFKYDTYKDGFPAEPTAAVRLVKRKDKKKKVTIERRVVSASPERAAWRELSALLTKRAADGLGGPLAMTNSPEDEAYDFQVCAMTRDQASMDIAIESVFHISPALQSNLAIYTTEVEEAEKLSWRLRASVEAYRTTMDPDWTPRITRTQARDQAKLRNRLAQSALLFYWTRVESNLSLLMEHIAAIGTDSAIPTRDAWRHMLFVTACEAYRAACGQETPRQIRAFAKGWQRLTGRQSESLEDVSPIKEDEQ